MTGLELLKAPGTTAGEIADIISEHCPPVVPTECDRLSCRECWLAWLTTGEPPKVGTLEDDTEERIDLTRLRHFLREIDDYVGRTQEEGPSDDGTAQEELERLKLLLREVDDFVKGNAPART